MFAHVHRIYKQLVPPCLVHRLLNLWEAKSAYHITNALLEVDIKPALVEASDEGGASVHPGGMFERSDAQEKL
jgi:hypothetical protein